MLANLWVQHGVVEDIRCTIEQIGEDCFELRLLAGDDMMIDEVFEEISPLLKRSGQLCRQLCSEDYEI